MEESNRTKRRQRKQPGYVHLATYVPKELHEKIKEEADRTGDAMSLISAEILKEHYGLQ